MSLTIIVYVLDPLENLGVELIERKDGHMLNVVFYNEVL